MTNKEIEIYLNHLKQNEFDFKNQNKTLSSQQTEIGSFNIRLILNQISVCLKSIYDFSCLIILLKFNKSAFENKNVVYTAKNLCTEINGEFEDRIVKPIFTSNIIFISHAKEYVIDKISKQRVFNLGGLVKLLSKLLFRKHSSMMRSFLSYKRVNDIILKNLNGNNVLTLCYYDLNGLSLVFSDYRHQIKLIEVQHGSIINYPPYAKPAPVKIADVFYVKNKPTIDYLKSYLCLNYPSEYRLIPYPKGNRKYVAGLHVFYASTIEFNGLHPVFINFLESTTHSNLHIIVRLHPREREKESIFKDQLDRFNVNFEFDRSRNWLENNRIENLIVVSPWSSSIEDSYDNGFVTVTIDPVGRERYKHLLDNEKCYYSENLNQTIDSICKKSKIKM